MQVRLLGPVDVVVEGVARPVSGLRRKAVLAVLGLTAGEVVSAERLLDVVWDGQRPTVGLNALQTHGAIGAGTKLIGLRGVATADRLTVAGLASVGFSDSTRGGGAFTIGSCPQ